MEEKYLEIKNFVESVYKSEENKMKLLARMALTFGLKLITLETIFGTKNDDMQHSLYKNNNEKMNAHLMNLFSYGVRKQENAVNDAYEFVKNLKALLAFKNENKNVAEKVKECDQKISEAMEVLSDAEIKKFKDNYQAGTPLTLEDTKTLVKFQVKYVLSNVNLCTMMKITNEEYTKSVQALAISDPELYFEYVELNKLHKVMHERNNTKNYNYNAYYPSTTGIKK